jgi:2,3-bisphosphoglycerate-dependent phosphoglycerate mutase
MSTETESHTEHLDLVILRHGQSEWNARNLFTGWQDVDLSTVGEEEARAAGALLAGDDSLDIRMLHTSVLTRAIRTAELALGACQRPWLPVTRDWRLNERHYGDLTGKNKKETAEQFGLKQVKIWRRSYDVPPPPLPDGDERRSDADPRYRDLDSGDIPATECLQDVVVRVSRYLDDVLVPDLRTTGARGGAVLVVAHGNSLRALRMILESISPEEITELEIPTGVPYRMRLDHSLAVTSGEYMGDADAAAAAARAVGQQAG